jgi:predicted RecB family nuclease
VAALQRKEGPSSLGSFHYTPILFHEDEVLTSNQRLRLAFAANVLGRVQEYAPLTGYIVLGTSCTLKKVSLKTLSQQAEDIISELLRYSSNISEPRQGLNSNCDICVYHDRCTTDAQRIDHLSQLGRISATEIDKCNAKGIFTVNQLSYTFRPRKRPKKQGEREYIPYHHSLKALAIREQKIHVFQRPPTVSATTRVYIDMEGDRAARNIYLIGLFIVRNDRQKYSSFWGDSVAGHQR